MASVAANSNFLNKNCNKKCQSHHNYFLFNVPYDYTSVMHYSRYAFTRNGGETIVPKLNSDIELGRRDGFSKSDILKINRMYQCSEARTDNENFVHPEKSASGTKLTYTTSRIFA